MNRVGAYAGASAAAIRRHYDLGNDFYALWLDADLVYSAALWENDDDLAAAQQRKLRYHADVLDARSGCRFLDVGCGWGAMLRYLVEEREAAAVVGLTLSSEQAEWTNSWPDDRYDVRVENWVDHEPTAAYDGIVSIGAFEHFADIGLTRAERVAAYRRFFEACRDWLSPGGRLSLQSIVKGSHTAMTREMTRDMSFIIDRIFTESELPWLSEALEASERLFVPVVIRNDPDHYARTCREWERRLRLRASEAESLVGCAAVADYLRYLAASARAFELDHVGLVRIGFRCR